MQTKLQELTEKIYNEGVQKAKDEAELIINGAKEKSAAIEKEAEKTAEGIIADARQKAETIKTHADAEIKMALNQAVSALKQDITGLITLKALQPPLKEVFGDNQYIKTLIEIIVKGWTQQGNFDLQVILPGQDKAKMEEFFKNQLAVEMNKGLELSFSDNLKSGFKIGPADGSYVISFSDQDFMNFFKAYLRPKTNELLFGETK